MENEQEAHEKMLAQVEALRKYYTERVTGFTDNQLFRAWKNFTASTISKPLMVWILAEKKNGDDQAG